MKSLLRTALRRHAESLLVVGLALLSGAASAQVLDISNSPLYGGRQPHPNVVVTTSVEFPTVGAAYLNIGYSRTSTFLGYFDPSQCYRYNGNSTDGLFRVSDDADANHECDGNNEFSGNFMNWATMSAIDEFRYAMTGGNRIDETGPSQGTVIERATLPDGSVNGVPSFYNFSNNFPTKVLNASFSSPLTRVLPNSIASAGTVYVANCGTLVFFSSVSPNNYSCGNPARDLGQFHVALNVCDNAEGPVRTDLCLQYGGSGGKYKPVGQTQVNAARMRFAAFGYLMDHDYNPLSNLSNPFSPFYSAPCNNVGWNECRYGGVLRAPMKYVGPTTFDANQTPANNTKREINADGTLTTDPEGTASEAGGQNSGFINYINKFGSSGVYKRYDPAGEMYYEAIRYYQNLGPTPLATTGIITNSTKDFFPFVTNWTDPIGSICSANYIVNLSDANTWDDTYLPGYNGSPSAGRGRPGSRPAEGGLDAYQWTARIGALESTTASITPNDVRPGLSNIANQNVANNASYAVAGAAYWANVNDIRSDLTGKQTIKTISFDVAEASIPIQDRQLYLMGKYGGFNNTIDRASDTFANPFWGTNPSSPLAVAVRTNSEWEDAVGSAYPANYLLASDPQKLINGLRAAFARINSQTGTLSGAALTSANLTLGAAGAYIATFDPAKWAGSVLFNSLSVDTNGNLVVSTTPIWDAGALLSARCGTVASGSTTCSDTDTSVNGRNIVTTAKVAGTRTGIPFTYPAILQADPLGYAAALNINPTTNLPDLLGQKRVNYLRGYRGDEASAIGFRPRDSAMGDIVNSGPVYAGPPTPSIPDVDYQQFYSANVNRPPMVYVGANDGMMHALRASDGVELFAFMPGYQYQDLNDLTNPGYAHQTYVDTVPKVQEAKVGSNWKTVLLGANGNGAQGIFALDVSDPTSFSGSKVMFEFTDADDPDFGSVTSTPEFAKLWVSGTASAPVYRYFAVVTGYNKNRTTANNRTDSSVSADTTNKGVLFLIALDHTLGTPWTLNSDYYKFTFPASNPALANGLGPVSLLASTSGDRSTAAMYFGDLQGNLWRFNTTGGSRTAWTPARGTAQAPLPIFVAQDNSGNRQPITARPELASGPFGSVMVIFGTGKYLGATDLTVPGLVQSEYAILDTASTAIITRSTDLVARTGSVSGSNVAITGATIAYTGPNAKKGWYLDFPSSVSLGERSVTKPAVRTGLLTFTTLTLSNDLCTPGNGYVYQVNALTGLPLASSPLGGTVGGYSSTVGIPGPPRVVDLTIQAGRERLTGHTINKKTQTTLVSGTAGKIAGFGDQTPFKVPPVGRINWREISNWNDKTNH